MTSSFRYNRIRQIFQAMVVCAAGGMAAGLLTAGRAGAADNIKVTFSTSITQQTCTALLKVGDGGAFTASPNVVFGDDIQSTKIGNTAADAIDSSDGKKLTMQLTGCGAADVNKTPSVFLTGVSATLGNGISAGGNPIDYKIRNSVGKGGTSVDYFFVASPFADPVYTSIQNHGIYHPQTTGDAKAEFWSGVKGATGVGTTQSFYVFVAADPKLITTRRVGSLDGTLTFDFLYK